jgi:hypothetical protein
VREGIAIADWCFQHPAVGHGDTFPNSAVGVLKTTLIFAVLKLGCHLG